MANTKSLLEIAFDVLTAKKGPMKMGNIIKKVMEKAGIPEEQVSELAPQFILDFMTSGTFWFCGEDVWDLKERQEYKTIDNDNLGNKTDADEEAEKNELKPDDADNITRDENGEIIETAPENDEDDKDEDDDDSDELDDIQKELQAEQNN